MIAGTLEVQMLANLARLSNDMNDAKTMVGGAMKNIEGAVGVAKTALAGLGAGLSVAAFVAIVKGAIDAADHLRNLSMATNIAVEDLAGLKMMALQSGTDLDGLAKGVNKLSVEVGKSPAEFKALGITAKDSIGQLKQAADIFNLIEDVNLRNALAMRLFGKSWAELAPILKEGSAGIQAGIDKGRQLSGMTKEMAEEAAKFNAKMVELNTTLGSGMTRALGPLLPGMHDIASAMAEAAKEGGLLLAVWVGMGGAIQMLAQEVRKLIGLPMNEVAALKQDAEGIQKALAAMSSSVNPGVRARYEEQLGVIKARLELLKREEEMAKAKPEAAKPKVDKAAADAAAARARALLNEGKDEDQTYRNLLKSLKDKLLLDTELTEVAKLQIALDALSAKQRATIGPEREKELKDLAAKVELIKKNKEAREQEGKNEEALQKMREEGAAASAEFDQKRGEALIAGYEQARQMEFEITLIGKTTQEREVAIKMRELENSVMDKTSESYLKLRDRMKDAIISKSQAEEAKTRAVGMWQSFESAGHQAFLSLFDTSKSVLERIRDMLKTHLIELLYQLTVKPFIIQIATSISGASVAEAAFGTGGGGGGLGGIGSLLSTGISKAFGGSGSLVTDIGGWLGLGGGAAISGTALAGEAAALGVGSLYGGAAAGAGGALAGGAAAGLAAVPVAGWVALAALAAYSMFGDDEDKSKPGLGWLANSNGYFQFANQDIPGADDATNEPMFNAYIKDLNDPTKYDQAKLAQFVNQQVDSSTAQGGIDALLKLIESAKIDGAIEEAVTANNAARDLLKQQLLAANDPLGFWSKKVAEMQEKMKTGASDAAGWRNSFLSVIDTLSPEKIQEWQDFGVAIDTLNKVKEDAAEKEKRLAEEQARIAADQLRTAQDLAESERELAEARAQAEKEFGQARVAAFETALNLSQSVFESLKQFQAGLAVSEYLSPLDRLAGARSQFQDLVRKARLGDTDAALQLGDSANSYLAAGRSVFASGSGFQDIFREVTGSVGDAATVNQRNLNVLLAETPAAIQAGFAEQVRELQEGFASVVDAVDRLSSGVRQAVS